MSESGKLILSGDLGEFFRQEVETARTDLGLKLTDVVEYYLVNLLCEFSEAQRHQRLGEEPLALMYKRAQDADSVERMALLKTLGDAALYTAGFFTEFIERSLVDLDYYVSMGGNAYRDLSAIVGGQRRGEAFGELYEQLGKRFTELVDVLNQIAERSQQQAERNTDLLRLYDRWNRTGSQRIQRLLVEKGLLPWQGRPSDDLQ